jgi:GTP1/Obg family GTP-binding protein
MQQYKQHVVQNGELRKTLGEKDNQINQLNQHLMSYQTIDQENTNLKANLSNAEKTLKLLPFLRDKLQKVTKSYEDLRSQMQEKDSQLNQYRQYYESCLSIQEDNNNLKAQLSQKDKIINELAAVTNKYKQLLNEINN